MPETKRTYNRRKSSAADGSETGVSPLELGRLQPQALELEGAVLGACLIEKDAYGQVSDILKPESFYDSKHRHIFAAMRSLATGDRPIDLLTVTEELRGKGMLEEAGGMVYLADLSQRMLSSANIEYHAHIIAQKALARELISYTSRIQKQAFDEGLDITDVMQEAEKGLFELSQTNLRKDFTQIDPVIDEAYQLLKKAAAREDGLSGLASGFDALDAMTNGWQNSDLIIIAARPAMGKTAFVLSMLRNIAITNGVPAAMFSLEMSDVQLVNRLMVNVCEIPGSKIRSGQLAPHEWGQLDLKMNELIGKPLYIDDTPGLTVFELRSKARRLVRMYGVRIIVIDYLQLMSASSGDSNRFDNRQVEVATISRNLKGLAKELNIPVIALSQLNRSVENRVSAGDEKSKADSKRPQLSDLRESGAIEQDADIVCFIHRPEYYKIYRDADGNDTHGMAEIIVAKHRNGAVGDVRLSFVSEFARFGNRNDANVPLPMSDDGVITSRRVHADGISGDVVSADCVPPMDGVSPFDGIVLPPPDVVGPGSDVPF